MVSLLESTVENLLLKGIGATPYFLKISGFKLEVNGNGSGYSVYSKRGEIYLLKKGERNLYLTSDFSNPGLDPDIKNFISKHNLAKT